MPTLRLKLQTSHQILAKSVDICNSYASLVRSLNPVRTTLEVPSASHRSVRAKPSNNIQHIPSGSLDQHREPDDVSLGEVAPDYLSLRLTVARVNCRPMNCRRLTVVRLSVVRWSVATPVSTIGTGITDCQVCVRANGKTSAHLKSVFIMSTVCSNASSKTWTPLPGRFIDDHLVEMFPLFDQARLYLVDVTYESGCGTHAPVACPISGSRLRLG